MHLLQSILAVVATVAAAAASREGFKSYFVTDSEYALDLLSQEPLDPLYLHTSPVLSEAVNKEEKTIYEVLKDDKEYSKLVKAIDFVGDDIIDVLNDTKSQITFFAAPNKALDCPHDESVTDSRRHSLDFCDAIQLLEEFESQGTLHGGDRDKKHKRKRLRKVIHAILLYDILQKKVDAASLVNNNTFPTALVLPHDLDKRSLRIRVTQGILPPTPVINLYCKVVQPNIPAKNGLIHGVDLPLLPPPSVFGELFMAPSMFSTFTSAIQYTGLAHHLDLHFAKHGKDSLKGARAVTVFAPTNAAFEKLPVKLRHFLFSPLGRHALKKVLEYHVVPHYIFNTDYDFNATSYHRHRKSKGAESILAHGSAFNLLGETPIFSFEQELPTLYKNCTIDAYVEKINITLPIPGPHKPYKTKTNLEVNDRPVRLADIVGLNGAVHVLDTVLDPRVCHHHDEDRSWGNWGDWLQSWASSD